LKHAFDFAKRILKQAEEQHNIEIETYNAGICWRCGKQVGKKNLKEAWDLYFCQKCYDIVTY
jgi:RNA polymerase-binding transcription factor DksA